MTAVIGILNRSGVALAADSAVTYTVPNGRKVLNTANKIFTLSKYHPVGIMIYNSASFMDVPWEVLIKEYRRNLSNRSFSLLEDYKIYFIKFIKSNLSLIDVNYSQRVLNDIINSVYKSVIHEVFGSETLPSETPESNKLLVEKIRELNIVSQQPHPLQDFVDYSFEEFSLQYDELLETNRNLFGLYKFDQNTVKELKLIVFNYIISNNFASNWSGLVFVGYGEKELYPSCIPVNIAEVVGNRVRYFLDIDNCAKIGNGKNAFIKPFAQRDVIDTLLTGVDFELNQVYIKTFGNFIENYHKAIVTIAKTKDAKLSEELEKSLDIDKIVNEYAEIMQKLKVQKHIRPTMQTVASLSKEDLAEMAESLVYLTYLKRRISSAEESVGGPVDVAIISKGDGFIWIKRKHYFKPELNQNFIQNYLKL